MEDPKQDHLNRSASKPLYAWWMLIVCSLLGPPLGAVLLLIGLSDPNSQHAFRMVPIAILFSYPIGGIPAFLTDLLSMLLRLKRNLLGIAAITAAGALLSGIWWLVMDMFSGFAFAACGAAAAFVLSVFLPKPSK
mgnify:CR=1 FL=1